MDNNSLYSHQVLLVDDEALALSSYALNLRYGGITNTLTCQDAGQVPSLLEKSEVDLLILDLLMPHYSGEDLLKVVNQDFPQVQVIVVTGVDDVETAVRCIKMGAFDYLVKPVESEHLLITVRRALEFMELERENRSLKKRIQSPGLENPTAFQAIITVHPVMFSLFKFMEAIAPSPKPVLITGETGVGKELMARALHDLSGLRGPFLAANAAGLDDGIFSDTLFGHGKGAFTGADQPRKGLLAQTGDGTLLLDEIGDLGQRSQIKLLRLLEQGEYFPLGSDTPKKSRARIIASTNRDLDRLMKQGKFRRDLYYRLMTHHLEVPPLRERKEDLPLLLDHFLEKAAKALDKKKPASPPELLDLLASHSFPGNVREMEAMVFDAVSKHSQRMMSMGSFKKKILTPKDNQEAEEENPKDNQVSRVVFPGDLPSLKEISIHLITEAMKRSNGNITIAAGMLGISHQALRKRLKKAEQAPNH